MSNDNLPKLCVIGASGRMGQSILSLPNINEIFQISALVVSPSGLESFKAKTNCSYVYSDIYDMDTIPDVIIDFSHCSMAIKVAEFCASHNIALVQGTTGITREDESVMIRMGEKLSMLRADNFSIGVNMIQSVCEELAR